MSNNIIYDAENEEEKKDPNVVYDYEEEIKKREEALDLPKPPQEDTSDSDEEYKIDEGSKNVFTDGMNGGQFIRNHHCPVCMFTKKNINELFISRRFSSQKIVAGYMATCANCGHVDFYTDNPTLLVKFLQGRAR